MTTDTTPTPCHLIQAWTADPARQALRAIEARTAKAQRFEAKYRIPKP